MWWYKIIKKYSLRSIVIETIFHFRPFHRNRVISLFSKSQHIFPHLLYSLLLFSIFISLPFSFFTLFSLYLAHLTQFFLISVPKSFVSITMERREYYIGGNSEFFMTNYWFSFNQGLGGAGFILSYPVSKALASDVENFLVDDMLSCLQLIPLVCLVLLILVSLTP